MLAATFNIVRAADLGAFRRGDIFLQLLFTLIGIVYAGFIGSRNSMLAYLVMALVVALLGATPGGQAGRCFHRWRVFLFALVVPVVGSVGFSSARLSARRFFYAPLPSVR